MHRPERNPIPGVEMSDEDLEQVFNGQELRKLDISEIRYLLDRAKKGLEEVETYIAAVEKTNKRRIDLNLPPEDLTEDYAHRNDIKNHMLDLQTRITEMDIENKINSNNFKFIVSGKTEDFKPDPNKPLS